MKMQLYISGHTCPGDTGLTKGDNIRLILEKYSIDRAFYLGDTTGDQYNIGFAYEQKGNLRKALASYKLALANGNKHVQKDITRVSEKIKQGNNRKIAFNKGIKQIKQKNAKHDLLLYGKEYRGNMT